MSQLAPSPIVQFLDNNGKTVPGGKLYTYSAGTLTKISTFTDATGSVPNSNPVLMDANGRANVWIDPSKAYKFIYSPSTDTDPPTNSFWTVDSISVLPLVGWAISAGTADVITGTYNPPNSALTDGLLLGFRASAANATTTPTFSPDGLTAHTITRGGGQALQIGDIPGGNAEVLVRYNLTNARWELLNPAMQVLSTVSPAQITSNQNDYSPTGLSAGNILRVSTDARRNITGLASGSSGRNLTVHNVGTFPAVFTLNDAASSAANRFAFGVTLGGQQSMQIQYDAVSSLWRPNGLPSDPVGALRDFAGGTVPSGYLACDGSLVSRTTYASLFNEVGTTWGAGDGATTFAVPPPSRYYLGSGTATTVETITSQTAAGNAVPIATNNTKWITGMPVVVSGASGFAGLTNGSWFIVRSANNSVQFATTLANAQNGTVAVVTGTGSAVLTTTFTARTVGELGGEEAHAINSNEDLAHAHSYPFLSELNGGGGGANLNNSGSGNKVSSSFGGNTAMNLMSIFAVVTKMIKY